MGIIGMTTRTPVAFIRDAEIYCYGCIVSTVIDPFDKTSTFHKDTRHGVEVVYEGIEFDYEPSCGICTEVIEGVTVTDEDCGL